MGDGGEGGGDGEVGGAGGAGGASVGGGGGGEITQSIHAAPEAQFEAAAASQRPGYAT